MPKDAIDIMGFCLDVVTTLGISVGVLTYYNSIRGTHFSTIQKCTVEFRNIVRSIQRYDSTKPEDGSKKVIKFDLLGLFNEQLFYAKKKYIPNEMKVEWLTTMFCYLIKNKEPFLGIKNFDLIEFSRVQNFVDNINKNNIQDMEVEEFIKNLDKKCFRKRLLKK